MSSLGQFCKTQRGMQSAHLGPLSFSHGRHPRRGQSHRAFGEDHTVGGRRLGLATLFRDGNCGPTMDLPESEKGAVADDGSCTLVLSSCGRRRERHDCCPVPLDVKLERWVMVDWLDY